MWEDEDVRAALLTAAAQGEHAKVRQAALGSLCGLAMAEAERAARRESLGMLDEADEAPTVPGGRTRAGVERVRLSA